MQKPFQITAEMEKEVEAAIQQATHDAPREMFGAPRLRRRAAIVVSNSEGVEQGPSNDRPVGEITEIDQTDPVSHPKHYTSHPSGVECITVTEWMSFNLGNAVKYIWRAGLKGYQIEDLKKARWYLDREIKRLGAE